MGRNNSVVNGHQGRIAAVGRRNIQNTSLSNHRERRRSATLALLSFKAEPLCSHTLYLRVESIGFFVEVRIL